MSFPSSPPSTLSPTAGPLPCTGSIRTSSAWRWACTPPGPIRPPGGSAGSWRSGPGLPGPDLQRRQLEVWAREPGVAAIGETGLDYHLPRKHRLTQLLWFRYQLGLARRLELPLVLHIRMADRDALAMLRRRRRQLSGGVVHCFQGDWDTARAYLDLGFCLGIGGALLRRESEALRDAVARAPLDRLLVETDSPYVLPDVPWTGSKKSLSRVRNSSLLLPRIVEEIARLKHLPPETAEAAILENTRRVFHLSGAENGG